MERAFLCGLSACLLLGGLFLALVGDPAMLRWGSTVIGLLGVSASAFTIRVARRSPPSSSWLTAIVAWVLGYFAAGFLFAPLIILMFALGFAHSN